MVVPRLVGNTSLRMCRSGNGEKKNGGDRQEQKRSLSHSSHCISLVFQDWTAKSMDFARDSGFVAAYSLNLVAPIGVITCKNHFSLQGLRERGWGRHRPQYALNA
jgi:hypothetical protein